MPRERIKRENLSNGDTTRVERLAVYASDVISELFVEMRGVKTYYVFLKRLSESASPVQFSITGEEADAFCEAWQEYKQDRAAASKPVKSLDDSFLEENNE